MEPFSLLGEQPLGQLKLARMFQVGTAKPFRQEAFHLRFDLRASTSFHLHHLQPHELNVKSRLKLQEVHMVARLHSSKAQDLSTLQRVRLARLNWMVSHIEPGLQALGTPLQGSGWSWG